MPPSASISGVARFDTRASLFEAASTRSTLASTRARITASRLNALMMRKPWMVSCMASRISAPPPYCVSTIERTRLISLRTPNTAGGITTMPIIDMNGA